MAGKHLLKIISIPLVFLFGTFILYIVILFAPTIDENARSQLKFPVNLSELKGLTEVLEGFKESHLGYVLLLFTAAYLWKQTFAIPGSAFLNILSGALFGSFYGFFLASFLSASGATCCFFVSKFLGKDVLLHYFSNRLLSLQNNISTKSQWELFLYLISTRLFPITPNWLLNAAAPILNIPVTLFYLSVFFGLMPYIYVCTSTGSLLSQLNTLDDLLTTRHMLQMTAAALTLLIPNYLKWRRSKSLASSKR